MEKHEISKLGALRDVLLLELRFISFPVLGLYLLGLIINLFTYDGRCSNLIMEPGRPACSYLYSVFAEPLLGIVVLAILLSWIWIPLLAIITIGLTYISLRKIK